MEDEALVRDVAQRQPRHRHDRAFTIIDVNTRLGALAGNKDWDIDQGYHTGIFHDVWNVEPVFIRDVLGDDWLRLAGHVPQWPIGPLVLKINMGPPVSDGFWDF